VPGSGGGPIQSSNMLGDRLNILQSYLQDLLMIPAIKESNQLKAFLGIKEHFPEFYNNNMDKMQHDLQENASNQFFSINLKDFTTDKNQVQTSDKEKNKNELLKFITGGPSMQ